MGWPLIAGALAAAYSAIKGGQNQGKSNELNEQALQLALADYEDRKPLREAFTSGALTPIAQAPDLSSVFSAARSDNPFATGGPARSAHVPSQLNLGSMERYGNGKTVNGPPPTVLPKPALVDELETARRRTGSKSPSTDYRLQREIEAANRAAATLPPGTMGSGRSPQSRLNDLRIQTGREQGGRRGK